MVRVSEITDKLNLLEWQIELLINNVEVNGLTSTLIKTKITREQYKAILDLILNYELRIDDEFSRYSFEEDMVKINPIFKDNTQGVELILKSLAEEHQDKEHKKLFKKLYGDMPKYYDVFPEFE